MDLGPIRFSAIEAFADLHDMSYEERIDLHDILGVLDQKYLVHIAEKREKKNKSVGNGPSKSAPRSSKGGRRRSR